MSLLLLVLLSGLVSVSGSVVNATFNPYTYTACFGQDANGTYHAVFNPFEDPTCNAPGPSGVMVAVGVPVTLVLCDSTVIIGLTSVPGNGSLISNLGLTPLADNTQVTYTRVYQSTGELGNITLVSLCRNPSQVLPSAAASWMVPRDSPQQPPVGTQYCCILTYTPSNNYQSNLYFQPLDVNQDFARLVTASNVTAPTSSSSSSSSGPLPSSSSSTSTSTSTSSSTSISSSISSSVSISTSTSSSSSSSGPTTSTSASGATPTSTGSTGTTSSTNTNTGSFSSSSSGSSSRSSSSSTGSSTQSSTGSGANNATPSAGAELPHVAALMLVTIVVYFTQ